MATAYFEEIEAGDRRDLGRFSLTVDEIASFAEQYDPQPIHTDPEAAADSVYGGIIASGWHTASMCMRLVVDGFLSEVASMGAIGLDELTWRAPVRPGDEITVQNEILETRSSESRSDRGYVRNRTVGTNTDGEEVISFVGINIIARRDGT